MVAPLVAIGAGLAAGGLAGSIAGKKKLPKYDTTRINSLINAGGEEQRRVIGTLRPETEEQLGQFRTDVTGAQDRARADQETSRNRLLTELDPVTSKLLQSQTDQLKRATFGAIPETQQATREALAASGGLGRGVSAESLARVPIEAARNFGEGAASLQQESLRTQQDALQNLQSQESQLVAKNLGIDENTFNTILNTGNAALINELNALVQESKSRTEGLVGAEQFRQTGNIASVAGANAENAALFGGITNLGGTLLGMGGQSGITSVPTAQRSGRASNEDAQRKRLIALGALRG